MAKYETFKRRIDSLVGINLDFYKEAQMKRRISSLMNRNKYRDFDEYFSALEKDDGLLKEFINYLTINVSEFYRNPSQWKELENSIIPELQKHNSAKLRVWSSACSTGEEPYSLVMLLSKFYNLRDIEILATDIDMGAIDKAKAGIYTEKALENLPKEFKTKFFKEEGGLFKISDEIKSRVKFEKIDLLKDRFPANMDLITCRNVMIYFTDDAKENLYEKFNKALKDEGIFFVGSTEQIIMPERFNFETFKTFFYKKTN